MSGSSGITNSPAWTVPTWYVDPANSIGCASASNSGTAATCSGGCEGSVCPTGVGPLLLVNDVATRWGTTSPTLSQNTTINVLSAETLNQEQIVLAPVVAAATTFAVIGAYLPVASFSLGTVTPKNRSTPQLLTAAGFTASGLAVGQTVQNTTHPSWARIEALSGSTATLSQPQQTITIAGASALPSSMPAEVDTWAMNDAVVVTKAPLLNLTVYGPQGGQTNSEFTGGIGWLENVFIPDNSGSPGNSVVTIDSPSLILWQVNTLWDTYPNFTTAGFEGVETRFVLNAGFNGGGAINCATVWGGYVAGFGASLQQYANLEGDVILASTLLNNSYSFIGNAYIGTSNLNLNGLTQLRVESVFGTNGPFVWGPGGLNVSDSGVVFLETGTFTAALLLKGTIRMGGSTTGVAYQPDAGTFKTGVIINPGGLDDAGGLQYPITGAKMYP
jgi:hypothetical protein